MRLRTHERRARQHLRRVCCWFVLERYQVPAVPRWHHRTEQRLVFVSALRRWNAELAERHLVRAVSRGNVLER